MKTIASSMEDLIVKGLEATYDDLYLFTGDELDVSHPEYLLTVNIAKSISKEFHSFKNYEIRIECPTKSLIQNSFNFKSSRFYRPLQKNNSNKRKIKGLEKTRKGRVDLALFSQNGVFKILKYIFEIKRQNQPKRSIIQDLQRLKAFCLLENQDGHSTLQAGYFVGLQHCKDYQAPDKIKQNLHKTEAKFKGFIQEVNRDRKVCEELRVFSLNNKLILDESELDPEYIGAHHMIAIIIKFKRNV